MEGAARERALLTGGWGHQLLFGLTSPPSTPRSQRDQEANPSLETKVLIQTRSGPAGALEGGLFMKASLQPPVRSFPGGGRNLQHLTRCGGHRGSPAHADCPLLGLCPWAGERGRTWPWGNVFFLLAATAQDHGFHMFLSRLACPLERWVTHISESWQKKTGNGGGRHEGEGGWDSPGDLAVGVQLRERRPCGKLAHSRCTNIIGQVRALARVPSSPQTTDPLSNTPFCPWRGLEP